MAGNWTKPHVKHEWLTTGTSYKTVWSLPYLLMSTDKTDLLSGRYAESKHKLFATAQNNGIKHEGT